MECVFPCFFPIETHQNHWGFQGTDTPSHGGDPLVAPYEVVVAPLAKSAWQHCERMMAIHCMIPWLIGYGGLGIPWSNDLGKL